jgi:hypothetical protein
VVHTEADYQEALPRLQQDQPVEAQQRAALIATGLKTEEVERAMEPLLSFQAQLEDEVLWYENACRGTLPTIRRLIDIGRQLIAVCISIGVTQRDLAERLGVTESVISRDVHNEYHGITVERAQMILDALNNLEVDPPQLAAGGKSDNARGQAIC